LRGSITAKLLIQTVAVAACLVAIADYMSPAISLGLLVANRRNLDLAGIVILLGGGYAAYAAAMEIDNVPLALQPIVTEVRLRIALGTFLVTVSSFLGGVFLRMTVDEFKKSWPHPLDLIVPVILALAIGLYGINQGTKEIIDGYRQFSANLEDKIDSFTAENAEITEIVRELREGRNEEP
jgi:hypothetical protein